MGIPRHVFIALAVLASHAVALAQELPPTPTRPIRIANWGGSNSAPATGTVEGLAYPPYPSTADPVLGRNSGSPDAPVAYPNTGFESVIDTHGWPVPMPFRYYPQGIVNEDGTGITESMMPACYAGDCFCTPPPCYLGTFYFSGLVLDRTTNLRPAGLIYDSTLTTELVNTSEFDLETEAGFRLGVWLTNPSGLDWNIEYFDVGNFSDTIFREDPAGLNAFFFGNSFPIAPAVTPPDEITAEYESTLDSLEFVLRARQWPWIAPQVGVRFMQVSEHFNLLDDQIRRTGMLSNTDNDLYGVEFGFQGLLWQWTRSRLETTVRAGTYYNDIDVDYYEVVYDAATDQTTAELISNGDTSWTSFSGDVRVTWIYQLGPRANFRIGYQALWLDGIALAVNQNTARQFNPPVQTFDVTDVLYQGGEIGFDLTW